MSSDTAPDRRFRRFLSARFSAQMAAQMQVTAVAWQIYDLTGDPIALGLVGLAQFATAIPLMPFAGQLADRIERRRILIACYAVFAATMAALIAAPHLAGPWLIYAIVAVFGAARVFEAPAANALLPNLVPLGAIKRAVALFSSANKTATIAGPALGGFLYALGPEAVYGTALLLLAFAVVCMIEIGPTGTPAGEAGSDSPSPWGGLVFIGRQRMILAAMSLDLVAVVFAAAAGLLPVFAKDILEVGPWGLGLLRSAPAAGGLLLGLMLARRPIERHAGPILLAMIAIYGLATIAFGLSTSFPLSLALLAVMGAADQVSVVIRNSLLQILTPDALRGRVSAAYNLFTNMSNQMGIFEAGIAAAWFGPVAAVVAGGTIAFATAASWAVLFPSLRRLDRL